MHFNSLTTISAAVACVAAVPVQFPLPDGFPNPSPAQLGQIAKAAGGPLPGGPLPTNLSTTAVSVISLLATNEIFETAYFTQLLSNITNSVPGYDEASLGGLDRQYVIDTITAIANQEQLHALGLNGILTNSNQTARQPCQYQTPVTSFTAAIKLANTFTDIVLGALPAAQTVFGADGGDESPLIEIIGAVLGQEGQQDGWFRSTQNKTPSAAPFLTGVSASFAFSALELFIIPGSCPQPLSDIKIPTFPPLNVVGTPVGKNSTLTFTAEGAVSASDNSIVYISGQNLPVTVPVTTSTATTGGLQQFTASFPFDSGFANGLTIAALVKGTGQTFASGDEVAAATVYGPGLIEVN